MKPNLHRRFFPLILTSLAALASLCQLEAQPSYEACSQPFHCGSVSNIGYPFWGENHPAACGYPGFELRCLGDEPFLNISSLIYRLLAFDNSTQTVVVSRNDLRDSLCPRSRVNTTLDFSLFDFYPPTNDQNITLFYGCAADSTLPFSPNQFSCRVQGTNTSNFFVTGEAAEPVRGVACEGLISARVNRTAAEGLTNGSIASSALLLDALKGGFTIRWLADNDKCNDCVRSGGLCGYDQGTAALACHCRNGSYVTTCNGRRILNGSKRGLSDLHKYAIIGASLGVVALIISSIIALYILRDKGSESSQNVGKFLLSHGSLAPKRYNSNEIKKITKSFSEKLGQGGYGIVYKGKLPDGGLPVAVKVLTDTHDNAQDFVNEVASISRTSHVNIVGLLGFCYERKKRALVYEFMPNKSLDQFIYKRGCSLELDKLYEIAVGVARGLEYLHRGCNASIVHFDIKPQNILLDQDFRPKISDFGLAKLFKEKQSRIISALGARGTVGYIAPEVLSRSFGVVSHKSDVYSYGMMLLQMAEARNVDANEDIQSEEDYFPDRIYERVLVEDKSVDDAMIEERDETARKMLLVGLWCIQTAPSDRPSMTKVVEMLEGGPDSIRIPPKPFLYSSNLSLGDHFSPLCLEIQTESSTEG